MPSNTHRLPPRLPPKRRGQLAGSAAGTTKTHSGNRTKDALVIAAMGLVSVAAGFGLYAQAGLAPGIAITLGLALFVVLVCIHVMLRRTENTHVLNQRLRELELELSGLRGPVAAQTTPHPARDDAVPETPPAGQRTVAKQHFAPRPAAEARAPKSSNAPATDSAQISGSLGALPAERVQMAISRGASRAQKRTAGVRRPILPPHGAARSGEPAGVPAGAPAGPTPVRLQVQPARPNLSAPAGRSAVALSAPDSDIPGGRKALPAGASARDHSSLPAPDKTAALEAPEEAAALESSLSSLALPAPPTGHRDQPAAAGAHDGAAPEADATQSEAATSGQPIVTSMTPVPPPLRKPADKDGAAGQVDAEISRSVEALRAAAADMQAAGELASSPGGADFGASGAYGPDEAGSVGGPVVIAASDGSADLNETAAKARNSDLIVEAVASERVEVVVEPITGLGDRKAHHFEICVRLRTVTGETLDSPDYDQVLAENGLRPRLDISKLVGSTYLADRLLAMGKRASVFSNYAGESLANDEFLDQLADVLNTRDKLSGYLVLSFSQSDLRTFGEAHWDTLDTLVELGFRFAVEDLTDLEMDFADLKAQGFDFVKLDADIFLHGMPLAETMVPAADLCRHLAEVGQSLIVGHIDDDMALGKVLGFGVLLGQGLMFGGPRALAPGGDSKSKIAAA